MKYLGLVAAEMLMIALGGRLAHAADMGSFSQPSPDYFSGSSYRDQSQPFEMGTGWYFRMDSAVSNSLLPILSPTGIMTTGTELKGTYGFGLGAGFKFNNLLRVDGTFEASSLQKSSISSTKLSDGVTNIICPNTLFTLLDTTVNPTTGAATNLPLGYVWSQQTGTCTETRTATTRNMFAMTNAFVDLGTWWKITPYVGAGVGMARISTIGNDNFYSNDNGKQFQPTWTPGVSTPNIWLTNTGAVLNPQPTIPNTTIPVSTIISPNWNKRFTTVQYNLAVSGMAGVAFDLTPNAKLDLGYRYLNYSDSKVRRYSQDVRIGFRYMVD